MLTAIAIVISFIAGGILAGNSIKFSYFVIGAILLIISQTLMTIANRPGCEPKPQDTASYERLIDSFAKDDLNGVELAEFIDEPRGQYDTRN